MTMKLVSLASFKKRRIRAMLGAGAAAAVVAAALTFATPASAATLTEITNFGTNPTNLRMHLYVPDRVSGPRPAILVAAHYCTGSGPAFFSGTQFASLADQFGFIVIYPSATRSGSCFDVATASALTHNGNSDPVGVVSMVRWVINNRNGDPNRVFVTGASSGAMLTNVLLGDYPDIFKAGAAFMGVPFACFRTDDPSMWNNACANGQVIHTPQEWGTLVRNAFPGFTGARPRMQVFHGDQDTTLRFPNFGEEIKQWTNVLGVSQTPSFTDTPQSGWTRTRYGGTGTMAPVEAIRVANVGHSLPLAGQALMAIQFFGLNGPPPTTPPPTTPPPTTPPPTTPPPTTPPPTTPPPTTPPPTTPPPTTSTPPPTGACSATYRLVNPWPGGFQAEITVRAGSSAINGWTVRWTLASGQTITQLWNGALTVSGSSVTVRNLSYNGILGANATTTFGFTATGTSVNPTLTCSSP